METVGWLYPCDPEAGLQSPLASLPPADRLPSLGLLCHSLGGQGTLITIMQGAGRPPRAHGFQPRGLWRLKPNPHLGSHSHDVPQLSLLEFLPKLSRLAISASASTTRSATPQPRTWSMMSSAN